MELTGYAVYDLYGDASDGSDRRKRNCIRCDGNRRNDQCDRVCVPDHDGSDDGYIRICYDHDRRSVYRPYYGSSGGSSGDAGQKNAITEVADGEIRFEHVDFSYAGEGGNLSLKDVNLHIKSGQTIGIIGGTGSAKSTLVQLIPRLYDVTKGTVKVGGLDVREYNLEALRDQVSMVLQKTFSLQERSTIISVGEMNMPVRKRFRESANLHRQMAS